MKLSDVMSASGLSTYAIVALVLFIGAWVAVAVWTFAPAHAARYAATARLPLTDDGSAPRTKE